MGIGDGHPRPRGGSLGVGPDVGESPEVRWGVGADVGRASASSIITGDSGHRSWLAAGSGSDEEGAPGAGRMKWLAMRTKSKEVALWATSERAGSRRTRFS